MTDPQARLRAANPVAEHRLAPEFAPVWERIELDRRSELGRLFDLPSPRVRPLTHTAAVGVAALAATAVIAVVLVLALAGGSVPRAFAGWTSYPTTPAAGQVRTAESDCLRSNPQLGSTTPALVDTRGPWTVLIYPASGLGCMVNPSITRDFGDHSPVLPFSLSGLTDSAPVNADAISPMRGALVYTGANSASPQKLSAQWTFTAGRVGADVTSLTVVLSDGTSVAATVANGWFAAWWPGAGAPQTAQITTATGTNPHPFYGSTAGAGSQSGRRHRCPRVTQVASILNYASGWTENGDAERWGLRCTLVSGVYRASFLYYRGSKLAFLGLVSLLRLDQAGSAGSAAASYWSDGVGYAAAAEAPWTRKPGGYAKAQGVADRLLHMAVRWFK